MLNNRILVIGLERRYLEFISQMKSDFIFFHLDHPSKFRLESNNLEGLIFKDAYLKDMGSILSHYKSKPIYGIGSGPVLDGIKWLNPAPTTDKLEELLMEDLGTLRAPPPGTGTIESGTVVKNKTFPSWGMGVVKRNLGEDLFVVNFPNALKITKKEEHICHKSILRIICSIKELTT